MFWQRDSAAGSAEDAECARVGGESGPVAWKDWEGVGGAKKSGCVVMDVSGSVQEVARAGKAVEMRLELAASVCEGSQSRNCAGWYSMFVLVVPSALAVEAGGIPSGFCAQFAAAFGELKGSEGFVFPTVAPSSGCRVVQCRRSVASGQRPVRECCVGYAPRWSLGEERVHRHVACVVYHMQGCSSGSMGVSVQVREQQAEADGEN